MSRVQALARLDARLDRCGGCGSWVLTPAVCPTCGLRCER